MPKYCWKQICTHGSFPEVGQKQKTEKKRANNDKNNGQLCIATPPRVAHAKPPGPKKKERKRERLNDGNNNGQATHGARKHAWRTQAAWAKMQYLMEVKLL